jgi:hypothetical protein
MGTSTARFNRVDKQCVELRQQIAAEGEKTRRHFDISVEQMKAERNSLQMSPRSPQREAGGSIGRSFWSRG